MGSVRAVSPCRDKIVEAQTTELKETHREASPAFVRLGGTRDGISCLVEELPSKLWKKCG